jgi:hypothetical protein
MELVEMSTYAWPIPLPLNHVQIPKDSGGKVWGRVFERAK